MSHLYRIGFFLWQRLRVLAVFFCTAFVLSGCVEYDVGIQFDSQTHGEIVQHIQLAEQLTNFSSATVQDWLNSIKKRTRALGGRTKQISPQELLVRIPFNNGAELEEKFNQFLMPVEQNSESEDELTQDLPEIYSHLSVSQNNWLLALRNRLVYDLDLRSLGVLTSNGKVVVSPSSILEMKFSLETPWGAKTVSTGIPGTVEPEVKDTQLIWTLQPGQLNHLEAIFWVPSPIGIGALVILLLVAAGGFLKYQLLPSLGMGKRPKVVTESKPST